MNTYLPEWIYFKKALVNPKSDDKESFKWAVIMSLFPEKHTERISKKQKEKAKEFVFLPQSKSLEEQVEFFERNNDVSVSVLTNGPEKSFLPWRKTALFGVKSRHATLFLYFSRFFSLRNPSRLLGPGGGKRRKEFCEGCFEEKKKKEAHFCPIFSECVEEEEEVKEEEVKEEEVKEEVVKEEEVKEEVVKEEVVKEEVPKVETENDFEKRIQEEEKKQVKLQKTFMDSFGMYLMHDAETIKSFKELSFDEQKQILREFITLYVDAFEDYMNLHMVKNIFEVDNFLLTETGFDIDEKEDFIWF